MSAIAELIDAELKINYQKKNPQFKDWMTPPDFYRALDDEFHFTMDPASSHQNALTTLYCTIDGTFRKHITNDGYSQFHDLDGLNFPWTGQRVFCNPPYDNSLPLWIAKAQKREAEVVVLLLPPSIDTKWFKHVWPTSYPAWVGWTYRWDHQWCLAKSQQSYHEVYLMEGRLKFYHPALQLGTKLADQKFDYSLPPVPGPQPRAGNLLAIFRK